MPAGLLMADKAGAKSSKAAPPLPRAAAVDAGADARQLRIRARVDAATLLHSVCTYNKAEGIEVVDQSYVPATLKQSPHMLHQVSSVNRCKSKLCNALALLSAKQAYGASKSSLSSSIVKITCSITSCCSCPPAAVPHLCSGPGQGAAAQAAPLTLGYLCCGQYTSGYVLIHTPAAPTAAAEASSHQPVCICQCCCCCCCSCQVHIQTHYLR